MWVIIKTWIKIIWLFTRLINNRSKVKRELNKQSGRCGICRKTTIELCKSDQNDLIVSTSPIKKCKLNFELTGSVSVAGVTSRGRALRKRRDSLAGSGVLGSLNRRHRLLQVNVPIGPRVRCSPRRDMLARDRLILQCLQIR